MNNTKLRKIRILFLASLILSPIIFITGQYIYAFTYNQQTQTISQTIKKLPALAYYRSNTGSNLLASCKERMWNGLSWSSEREMPSAGSTIRFVRAVNCPVQSRGYEKIVVTLSDDGYLDAYVWDGSSWLVTNNIGYVGTTVNAYRSYDIAYERSSGKAMLVYAIYSTDTTKDLAYKTWDGIQWSSEAYIDDPATSDIQYYWVRLTAYPLTAGRTNEIAMIASEGTTGDVNAWIWNGSSWGNNCELETQLDITTLKECISVEYEQQSGEAMFIWAYFAGAGSSGYIESRKWAGFWRNELTPIDLGKNVKSSWFTLKADSPSNRLMTVCICFIGFNAQLKTVRWDGSSWTLDSHDTQVDAYSSRCADFAWEPSGSKGLLVWGTTSGSISYKTFTAPSTWSEISTVTASGTHPWIQLRRNTKDESGGVKILGAMLNSNNNLGALKWDGSTLTNMGDSTFTSNTATTTYECFDMRFRDPS